MTKIFFSITGLIALAGAAMAQGPDWKTFSGSAKGLQGMIKGNLVKAAEKMPEESYGFKPSHDIRSFGELVGHVADAQYLFCSATLGEKNPAPGIEKGKKTKAELVSALKEAFAYCDKAYDALTEENAKDIVKFFGGDRNRQGVLMFNVAHNNEHYGNMVTYMRIRGLVPPSSERR